MITELYRRIIPGRRMVASSAFLLFVVPVAAFGLRTTQPALHLLQSASQAPKNDYAVIYGTVWGVDEHPQAGVRITIRRTSGKKAKWELVSDSRGEFAQRVPVGGQDYIIEADIKTSKGHPKPAITVHIDDNERKDVSLHLSK